MSLVKRSCEYAGSDATPFIGTESPSLRLATIRKLSSRFGVRVLLVIVPEAFDEET
jgi:hypothetical protein